MNRRDPTRSAGLRRQGRAMGNRRVFELHKRLRTTLQDHDVIGLREREDSSAFLSYTEAKGDKLERGETMLRDTIADVLSDIEWLGMLIVRAVQHGVNQVGQELKVAVEGLDAREVMQFHAVAAGYEVRGISNETQRRVLRHVSRALEADDTPEALMREVRATLEKITRARLMMLVNTSVVRGVNGGKLFAYGQNGVKQVGIIPEWLPARHTHDAAPVLAAIAIERRRKRRQARQHRIAAAAESALQALRVVHILTAGDDKVCNLCNEIAANAPYEINTALSLIPAHPNCRCAFVAFGDERFAEMEAEE